MLIDPYPIPLQSIVVSQEIKKSRFITQLAHTPGIEYAKAYIQQIKLTHPRAKHHCWGYVAGPPLDSMQLGFSDDGEPSGTAGKPILAQLLGANLGEICAVVTRYSGGIKLGTGGLVRAYAGGVKQAIEGLTVIQRVAKVRLKLEFAYNQQSTVDRLFRQFCVEILDTHFSSGICMLISLEAVNLELFNASAKQQSQGMIRLSQL